MDLNQNASFTISNLVHFSLFVYPCMQHDMFFGASSLIKQDIGHWGLNLVSMDINSNATLF